MTRLWRLKGANTPLVMVGHPRFALCSAILSEDTFILTHAVPMMTENAWVLASSTSIVQTVLKIGSLIVCSGPGVVLEIRILKQSKPPLIYGKTKDKLVACTDSNDISDHRCEGEEHDPDMNGIAHASLCTLPRFHPPADSADAPPLGHVSSDGHSYNCKNPA